MIVITGGAGFIGSNLAAGLEARGLDDIIVVDWLGHEDKWRNLAQRNLADVIMPEDLWSFLEKVWREVDAVFHMGAISATTERDVDLIVKSNIRLSLDLWEWCTTHQKPFIYASSAATYGDGSAGFDDQADLADLHPMNAYGWSKHLVDRRIASLVTRGDPTPPFWAGMKFFNVYGPNEYHKEGQMSVVAQMAPKILADAPVTLFRSHRPDYEDGGQLRDFVHVDDTVDVMSWLYENRPESALYNCGTGQARSFLDLAKAAHDAVQKPLRVTWVDTPEAIRDKYQYFTESKTDRLRQAGYTKPFTRLEDGVAGYVRDHLAQEDPYR
ncbi:MAG: ADP-glyceromanno-heptose 6-epimerase [Alphaproteobacteria bacterium]|nr:ADP-glyceromanno-heptose 6-epimerase [Alphaproteobacteria bacterium]